MEIKVFNKQLDLIAILEEFTSLRWVRRYFKSGEFELHCPLTTETLKYLKNENIIYIGDDEAGIIETRELATDENGLDNIVCRGKFLTSYLDRRINWNTVVFEGKAEDLMRHLVNINAINPSDTNRKIDNLILGSLTNLSAIIRYQNSYDNLIDCLESIGLTTNYGYRVEFDYINKKLKFKVYSGKDLTINQSNYAPCLFSRDFENILKQAYTDSNNNYRNVCLIAGAGEGAARKKTSIGTNRGIDRYELFVDAKDISDKETITVIEIDEESGEEKEVEKEVEIPWNRYEPMLLQRGSEKLEEYKKVETFESEINVRSNLEYKKDFDLGDIVTCYDSKWELTINTRITEIEEVYEEKGLEVNITFGNNIPTILDKIKSKMR